MTPDEKELLRLSFERDAIVLGFDVTRLYIDTIVEPWSEYVDSATGHRWAGWLAACEWSEI